MGLFDGKVLLVVDDEADLREPVAMELESMGCKVFQAKNGREAFAIVQQEKLDAVISDIRMPGGDGIELLTRIKEFNPEFPVVMLITGFSDLTKEDAYHAGAEVILSKPFDLDELDDAVAQILKTPDEKWQTPIVPTKIKKKIQQTYLSLVEAAQAGHFSVGRGGFFIDETNDLIGKNELVAFHIKFESGDILNLEGVGTVRWVRKESADSLPPGCGIEYQNLPDEIRQKLHTLLDEAKPTPFIPKGAAPLPGTLISET